MDGISIFVYFSCQSNYSCICVGTNSLNNLDGKNLQKLVKTIPIPILHKIENKKT